MSLNKIITDLQNQQQETEQAINAISAISGSDIHLVITKTGDSLNLTASKNLTAHDLLNMTGGIILAQADKMTEQGIQDYRTLVLSIADKLTAKLDALYPEVEEDQEQAPMDAPTTQAKLTRTRTAE